MLTEILVKAVGSAVLRKGAKGAAELTLGAAQARELESAYAAAVEELGAILREKVPEWYRDTLPGVLTALLRDDEVAGAMIVHALSTPETSLRAVDCSALLRERFAATGGWEETLPIDLDEVAGAFPQLLIRSIERAAAKPGNAIAPLLEIRRTAGIEATLLGVEELQHRRALELLRRASAQAADDAAFVDAGTRTVRFEDGLYVERDVEPRVAEDLKQEQAAVLITGEAGQGKTTLLWNLRRTLSASAGREVWLIKPTRLFSGPSAVSREDFLHAVAAARAEGRTPMALFDTVDVLLHDETTIDGVRDLFEVLHRAGCTIVASTRPAEAPILRTAGIRFAERLLGNYNERTGELERAITAHVRSFYGDYDPARHGEYVVSTISAVAAGLPLRQVCLNPLTLRMLFVLYAPEAIPSEINVVELFREYWKRRVQTDTRPGFATPHDTRDLAVAAETIALTMLHEGTPEVDAAAVEAMLAHWSVPEGDVAALQSRGIVQRSRGKVAFFHQTFFEHAAARMLLRRAGAAGIASLLERVRSRGFDPFLSPVLEQALLLAPADPVLSSAADDALHRLLDSDDVNELKAALSIFAMRDSVPATATERVRKLLTGGRHEAAVVGFLTAGANAPAVRTGELLDLIATVWNSGASWRIRQKTFVLLERLAGRAGRAVRACLERIGAVDYVLSESVSLQPESELRDVLRVLAAQEPAWTFDTMVRLYAAAGQRSDGLRVKMLRLLGDRAAAFGEERIASRFEEQVEKPGGDDGERDDRADFHAAWARLWTIEWSAGVPLQEILRTIPSQPARARGRLLALRDRLGTAPQAEVEAVWDHVLADPDPQRRPLAMVMLWAPFLSGDAPAATSAAIRARMRETLLRVIDGRTQEEESLRSALIDTISRANASPETIREMFAGEPFSGAEPWLDGRRLARIAGTAYLAGHEGAKAAISIIAADPAAHAKSAELLLRILGSVELTDELARLFAALVRPAGAAKAITAAERLSERSLSVLARQPEFLSALEAWRIARSLNTRRDATRLVSLLIRRKAMAPPPFDELAALLRAERDPVLAGHLAMLAGVAAQPGRYNVARVVDLLKPAVLGDEKTRTNALDGLMAAITGNPAADAHLEEVLDLIMLPPTDQGRLKHAYGLLLRLLEVAPRRAVRRFHELLLSEAARSLGVNARRDLRSALETPARAIIHAATNDERVALVRDIPALDRLLAPAVVKPLCNVAYGDLAFMLEEVAVRADPDVQLLIRQNAKVQQRVIGSSRWLEVWPLVSGT